jgi:hypothetical protein
MNIYYTYITRLINSEKYYVGRHTTKNIDDGYLGSGKWVRSIKNKELLYKEILSYYETFEELVEAEKLLINEHIAGVNCMNFNNNPIGFGSGDYNIARSEKERKRRSEQFKNNHPMRGRSHSKESREKMSNSRIGQSAWNKNLTKENNESLQKMSSTLKGNIPWNKGLVGVQQGSMKGKKHSTESLLKIKKHVENRDYSGENNPMHGKSAVKGRKWFVNIKGETLYTFPEDPQITPDFKLGRKWKD